MSEAAASDAPGRTHSVPRCLMIHVVVWGLTLILGLLATLLSPFTRGEIVLWLGRFWSWAILKSAGVTLRVEGLERFERGRPYVLVPNHASNFDIYSMILALKGRYYRFIAKKEVLYLPVFGWALWAGGFPIVDRRNNARARRTMARLAERMRRTGLSLISFPEGTRNKTDAILLPFKKGPFVLALDLQAPILPISIRGARRVQSRHGFWFSPGEITVVFHEPIPTEGLGYETRDSLRDRTRDIILESLSGAAP
ncbi:MAG: lysophospholipid acyltransferase family protein [Acidobacteriota bacterium]